MNLFARAALVMATEKPERFTAAVRAGYLAPYDNYEHRVAVHRFVQDIPLAPTHPSYATLTGVEEGLARLSDKPVMLAWGMRDWCFTPRFRAQWQSRLPAARVVPIESAGHLVTVEAPREVEAELRALLAR